MKINIGLEVAKSIPPKMAIIPESHEIPLPLIPNLIKSQAKYGEGGEKRECEDFDRDGPYVEIDEERHQGFYDLFVY